jgi:hypothetical protein
MWKYLCGFVLLLAVSLFVSSKYEQYAHEAASNSQSSSGAPVASANAQNANDHAEQTERDHPRWYLAYQVFGWPSGITVWALFLTLIVIADQTRHTARSAKAAEDAASASLRQIDHALSSGRAWLTIFSANPEDSILRQGGAPKYVWKVKNVGNTPARIVETQAVCQITETSKMLQVPIFPSDSIAYKERILGAGESLDYFTYWTKEGGEIFRESVPTLDLVWLTAYGYVRYKTVLDETVHESRFCDTFIESYAAGMHIEFRPNLEAPEAYTKHT